MRDILNLLESAAVPPVPEERGPPPDLGPKPDYDAVDDHIRSLQANFRLRRKQLRALRDSLRRQPFWHSTTTEDKDKRRRLIRRLRNTRHHIEQAELLFRKLKASLEAQKRKRETLGEDLELRGKGSPGLDAFMQEYWETTQEHPLDRHSRLIDQDASLTVYPFDGMIHISDIASLSLGRGNGTRALKMLCDLADRHRVVLSLTAKAYNPRANMDTADLHRWYGRYGFEEVEDSFGDDEEGYEMERRPR